MKLTFFMILAIISMVSCQESLEKRAAREACEYTYKYCPTPIVNYTRTDSVVFDQTSKTYNYYCSVTDIMDNENIINENKANILSGLLDGIRKNTGLVTYKKAGFNFAYTLYSNKQPGKILFKATYTPKDYNN